MSETANAPRVRSRRAVGQDRSAGQERSMEGRDIKYVYQNRTATVNGGIPTQRAKIEYRQLGDYEVVDGKTVATDPSGQGRPVLEWTVTFNEAEYDKMGGYYYFTIPKNVSDPYKVVTEYNNGAYGPRDGWVDGNVTPGGSPSAEGQQFIDAGIWDEAFVIKADNINLKNGTKAPIFSPKPNKISKLRDNTLYHFQNQ